MLLPALTSLILTATPHTFRVDYFHTGDSHQETFAIDRLVVEPLAWPGNPDAPLDDTNAGVYFFEVRDLATHKALYSRGFASIFGEWVTTAEGKDTPRTFNESFRFPAPAAPVQVALARRDPRTQTFKEVWTFTVDPSDPSVDTSRPAPPGALIEIQNRGDPAHKVDLLILGDGYTPAERGKFEKDARRLTEALFAKSPFKERRNDFNVWALCPPSAESGISRPSTGIHRRSPLGATYDAFGSERYILTFDNHALRDAASFAPYELMEILVNANTYGGGGIFNLYSTAAAGSAWSPYLFVHEFGHHMAGLADEYFTSDAPVENPPERMEPWEPNVTALRAPERLKWKNQVAQATPLPTPWDKERFESWEKDVQKRRRQIRANRQPESDMDALFVEEKVAETRLLGGQTFAGKVGAFEGANYESRGFFRPELDCVMFSRDDVPFCSVCRNALNRIIDLYAKAAR